MKKKILGSVAIFTFAVVVGLNIKIVTNSNTTIPNISFAETEGLAQENSSNYTSTGIATTTAFECSITSVEIEYTWGQKNTTSSGNVGAGVSVPYGALWTVNGSYGSGTSTSGGSYGYKMTTTTAKWSASGITCKGASPSNCHPINPCS